MKKLLLGSLLFVAGGVMAVTPGKVLKMVPQSGVSKCFDLVTENGITVRVQFYTPQIFRILAAPQKLEPELDRTGTPIKDEEGNEKTYVSADYSDPLNDSTKAQILVAEAKEDATRVSFADNRDAGTYTFKTPALTLTVKKEDCTFALADVNGTTLWEEAAPLEVNPSDQGGTVQTLKTHADEFFYGGGQQNGYLSHKGRKIDIRADSNWDEGGHPNPAPYYMTNTGYGVLRHTFAPGVYDFSAPDQITTQHDENRFDAFYFVGGNFGANLNLYTKFTGRPNFIPMWGLQLGDADAYITRDKETKEPAQNEDGSYKEVTHVDALKVATKYRENAMPGGWLLVNDGYGCNHMQLAYTADALKQLGFETGLWTEGMLDRIRWEVGFAGSRVQKIDVAWSWKAYQHALECNKIAADGIADNANARPFVWTVQGWAGTQRYGICWTGDQYGSWDLIRYHIPTLTGSSMSGQAYATTDVDGIFGGSNETFLRDLQWKCWTTAIYVMNGWSHINKGPWSYPEPYLSLNREALLHKNRLVPYVYTHMRNAWETGAPIVRPLVYNYPEDRATWGEETKYQFMLGEDFLVAPVYNSMKLNKGWKKDIYLPEGQWIDYNDGRRVTGPMTLAAYPIDLSKLPVFVKAGAIVPMYPEMLVLGDKPYDPLTLDIYPDMNGIPSTFTLYEDDGSTQNYQSGEFSRQTIDVVANDQALAGNIKITIGAAQGAFDGMLLERGYELVVHTQAKPTAVTFLNPDGTCGQEVLEILSDKPAEVYANSRQGWYYDAEDKFGTLRIKLAKCATSEAVALNVRTAPFTTIAATPAYPVPEITNEIDKSDFVLVANSQSGDGSVRGAFDGSEETMWHSYYGKDDKMPTEYPYVIDVDMTMLYPINGITYLPRASLGNGVIKGYKVEAARFPGKYEVVAEGELDAFDKVELRTISFDTTWARYLRITATSSQNGEPYASAAEIDVLQDLNAEPLKDETKAIGTETLTVDGNSFDRCRMDSVGANWTLDLDGTWEKVKGHAGMLTGNTNKGPVTFRIFADDQEIFSRIGMEAEVVKQLIDVDIPADAKQLRFTLHSEGNVSTTDTGVWTDLHLFRAGSAR